jgi:integrase
MEMIQQQKPIIQHHPTNETRILRPSEFEKLCNVVREKQRLQLQIMLLTGMRYSELRIFYKHPEWFNGKILRIPDILKFDELTMSRMVLRYARKIRLSEMGRQVLPLFFEKSVKFPLRCSMDTNLKLWAYKAKIDDRGMTTKTLRKTWESWILKKYNKRLGENYTILLSSQGYNNINEIFAKYLSFDFTIDDIYEMGKYTKGWM